MKNQIARKPETQTEALLQGMIAECLAIIRTEVLPAARAAERDWDDCLRLAIAFMDAAVRLADAVGRLRGTAPVNERHHRITVERIQRLSNDRGEGG